MALFFKLNLFHNSHMTYILVLTTGMILKCDLINV
jgi:hypothetical protein